MPTLTQNLVRIGDVLLWEAHPGYCSISSRLLNTDPNTGSPGARTIQNPRGLPVKGTLAAPALAYAGEEANVIGIIVDGPPIVELANDGATTDQYKILVRGPAMVHEDNLKDLVPNDPNGDAYDWDDIITELNGLTPPVIEKIGPTKVSVQST